MEEFTHPDVQACSYLLSKAETPSDAVRAWVLLQKKHPNLSAMVALSDYEQSALPASIKKYVAEPHGCLVPYFSSEKIYFLDDDLLTTMFTSGDFRFNIDYTLMFDTNVASYVNKLVRGERLGEIQARIVSLVDDLLHDDLNFDHIFYMAENVKNVLTQIERSNSSQLRFWRSLNKGFRRNLVSLQIFRSIDCQEYKRTLNPKPRLTYRQAVRNAAAFSYDFYASDAGKDHILNFVLVQRIILLQLIGMVRIQLSSNKGTRSKLAEYTAYVNDVVGAYFDREAIVAHKYFDDRNSVRILGKVQKGCSKTRLLKRLDNIAWDMATPRFMEKLLVSLGQGRYFIPLLLTFDSALRELLSLYPVKGVIFDRERGAYLPLPEVITREYFGTNGCLDLIENLHSEEVRSERLSRPKQTRESVRRLIRREYKLLRSLI